MLGKKEKPMQRRVLFFTLALVAAGCGKSNGAGGSTSSATTGSGTSTSSGAATDTSIIATKITNPNAMAVDASSIYFSASSAEGVGGGVFKVPINGGTPVALSTDEPAGIAVDDAHVYFRTGDTTAATFKRVNKDGTGEMALAGPYELSGGDFTLVGTNLYSCFSPSQGSSGIVAIPTAGGAPTVVVADDPATADVCSDLLTADATNFRLRGGRPELSSPSS